MDLFVNKVDDGYGGYIYDLTGAGYVAFIALILMLVCVAALLKKKKNAAKLTTLQIVFSGAAMALAFVTSTYCKLFEMPMGGSVTLFSMLFIVLIAYWYGLKTGLMVGIAYGLLQMIIDPYIISLPQMLCDYPLAFGALGLAGLFTNKKWGLQIGYVVAVFGRFVFAVLSGVIFFASYTPEGMNPIWYSITYNGGYLLAEAVMTLVVICIPAVAKAMKRVKNMANEK